MWEAGNPIKYAGGKSRSLIRSLKIDFLENALKKFVT
jgi:hypothetical protein